MPMTLNDREQGFEAKFVHDQDMQFLTKARRDKLFAVWAAQMLGLDAAGTEALVKAVIAIPDGPGHDQAVLGAISARLEGRPEAAPNVLAAGLERCLKEAQRQLSEAPPSFLDAN